MIHTDFIYAAFRLQDIIDEFLEKNNKYDLNKKEFMYVLEAFYSEDVLKSKDYRYANSIFKRLIGLGLLFKVHEKDNEFYCSIDSKGILYVNELFFYLDDDYKEFIRENKISKEAMTSRFLKRGVCEKRLIRT